MGGRARILAPALLGAIAWLVVPAPGWAAPGRDAGAGAGAGAGADADADAGGPRGASVRGVRVVRVRDLLLRAITHYQQSDFTRARELLDEVLGYVGSEGGRTAQEAHAYLACVEVAFGHTEEAVARFERALAIRPDMVPPVSAPKIEAAFEQARARYRARVRAMDHDPPRLTHRPRRRGRYGEPLAVEVDARDVSGVRRVVLAHRLRGNRGFSRVTMEHKGGGRFIATVPSLAVARPGVEYYVEAWDALGNGPGLKGSASAPILVKVSGGPEPGKAGGDGPGAWYTRWWVWATVAGVVAVAGGVAGIVYATRTESGRFDMRLPAELNP